MDGLDKKSIMEMANGAFLERVDYEMGRVIENILDPNAKATGKRKITVTLELVPDNTRRSFTVSSTSKSVLVPTDPIVTTLCITAIPGGTGEMVVAEMVPQLPGQLAMDGTEQGQPKVLNFQVYQKAAMG